MADETAPVPTPAPVPAPTPEPTPSHVIDLRFVVPDWLWAAPGKCHSGVWWMFRQLKSWAGVIALSLILTQHGGCSLPHIPWPIPTPTPSPTPPEPSPIPGNALHLMIVTDPKTVLPVAQAEIINSATFRTWLQSNKAEFRFYHDGQDMTNESEPWKTAMARPRKSLPWLVVGNGTTGIEGPLPATLADTQTLVQKYISGGK